MLPAHSAQLDILQHGCVIMNVYRNRARGEVLEELQKLWEWGKGASMHQAFVLHHVVPDDQAAHLSGKSVVADYGSRRPAQDALYRSPTGRRARYQLLA